MKQITSLTDNDCIHCRTQEEFNAILSLANTGLLPEYWEKYKDDTYVRCEHKKYFFFGSISYSAYNNNYTIHPASDFLTPTVSVLAEAGEYKVIKHKGGCIVIKDDKAMTLTEDIVNWIKDMK